MPGKALEADLGSMVATLPGQEAEGRVVVSVHSKSGRKLTEAGKLIKTEAERGAVHGDF